MKKIKNFVSKIDSQKLTTEIKNSATKVLKFSKDHCEKAWFAGLAAMGDFSQFVSQTDFVRNLNTYKSDISRAMDEGFKIGSVDIETGLKMNPSNHRILDGGHGFFESIEKAKEVGAANGWSDGETFQTWFQSYFTDMSSPAGMPVLGKLTDDAYVFLKDIVGEETARDLLTINGQEAIESLIGGSLAAVSLIMAWKKEDKENFSKALGSMGLAGAISMNPVILVVLIVAAALGYNTLVCHKAVTKGAAVSATALLTSFVIPGPVLLGLIPGVVLAFYVNKKMGKDFDLSAHIKIIYDKMKDPVERQKIISSMEQLIEDLRAKVSGGSEFQKAG